MNPDLQLRYDFRDAITSGVIADLVGPSSETEVIGDPPLTQYLSGILYPRTGEPDEVLVDVWAVGDVNVEDGGDAEPVSSASSHYPSSFGLTFAVAGELGSTIQVESSGATYTDTGKGWLRTPVTFKTYEFQPAACLGTSVRQPLGNDIELFVRVRQVDDEGHASITIALINAAEVAQGRGERDAHALLQPRIVVRIPEASGLEFEDRSLRSDAVGDADQAANRLLFRHVRNLAIGHGCAVEWDDSGRVVELRTTFTPTYDLPLADSNPAITGWYFDMRAPSERSRSEVVSGLSEFVDGYERWLVAQTAAVLALPADLQPQARLHIGYGTDAARRMRRGLELLGGPADSAPYRAFTLMNEAMTEQRVRSERVLNGKSHLAPEDIPASWRPFQLAFILLCIEGLIDENSDDRQVADLLWFPTGGGKTEAYLGLIAFTLFLRRLRHRPHGVSAIMRYTLRLLTAQQFERAALLMCCCEAVRRRTPELGAKEFEVGLYLGRAGSPNSINDARKALDLLRRLPNPDLSRLGNPVQIRLCVWCGTPLGPEDHDIPDGGTACQPRCPNQGCDFRLGLPWFVVDTDLYNRRPSLIIGTVDKFAGLAWKEEAGRLFNRGVEGEAGIDLIIQDELHLIAGPLGTLTGLFETAIDSLATNDKGIRPKVIASTATIRRASEQVSAVFDRVVAQFPPPALDSRDSYFAVQSPRDRKGDRRYVGLMAPGNSQSTLIVRTYARLFYEATCGDWPDVIRDTYWTLVGYFNSLRVLASAQLQVIDDVADRLAVVSGNASTRVPGDRLVELNSRATSADIAHHLRQLRNAYPSNAAVDVVLATNMISVGVDVDRLGVMAVAGQPQTTAEYIQSTSRVGRRHPGLVFALLNAGRSRDRSHYEDFRSYHSALYRQVEATSATPFSPRARDRALHAVLVAMCRHTVPGLNANDQCGNIESHVPAVMDLIERIVARALRVDENEADAVRDELVKFLQVWRARAAQEPGLRYSVASSGGGSMGLLIGAEDVVGRDEPDSGYATLRSMRDVDRVSYLYELGVR